MAKKRMAEWDEFRYIVRQKDTIDGRKDARRIKAALTMRDVPRIHSLEIETGVSMMMLCAGKQTSPAVPLDVQYLAAHQYVQDYHAGLTFCTHAEVDRVLAVSRAAMMVRAALDEIGV